jgi:hypothetical protein
MSLLLTVAKIKFAEKEAAIPRAVKTCQFMTSRPSGDVRNLVHGNLQAKKGHHVTYDP